MATNTLNILKPSVNNLTVRIQSLNLLGTEVTDAGLASLAPLEDLRGLDLTYTVIGDEGLRAIGRFAKVARTPRGKDEGHRRRSRAPGPARGTGSARRVGEPGDHQRRIDPCRQDEDAENALPRLYEDRRARARPPRRVDEPHFS